MNIRIARLLRRIAHALDPLHSKRLEFLKGELLGVRHAALSAKRSSEHYYNEYIKAEGRVEEAYTEMEVVERKLEAANERIADLEKELAAARKGTIPAPPAVPFWPPPPPHYPFWPKQPPPIATWQATCTDANTTYTGPDPYPKTTD